MKSHQLIKHSLNRTEKIPVDYPVPMPLDCSVQVQIGPLSLCLYCTGKKVHVVCFMQHLHEKEKKGF